MPPQELPPQSLVLLGGNLLPAPSCRSSPQPTNRHTLAVGLVHPRQWCRAALTAVSGHQRSVSRDCANRLWSVGTYLMFHQVGECFGRMTSGRRGFIRGAGGRTAGCFFVSRGQSRSCIPARRQRRSIVQRMRVGRPDSNLQDPSRDDPRGGVQGAAVMYGNLTRGLKSRCYHFRLPATHRCCVECASMRSSCEQ